MTCFTTKLQLRIDWSELDVFGHVNNLEIMKYVQSARVNYLELVGLMQMQSEAKMGPILASVGCQFRKPLFFPGYVTVFSRVEYVKNTSFRIHHEVYNENDELAAEAHDIIVFYDFVKNVKRTIPDDVRVRIENLERDRIEQ
jgi:acyl-CoA thioester hydrolase